VKKTYRIVDRDAQSAAETLEQFAKANGQLLLPLVELITQARVAVDEVIGTVGRQTIETILMLSAQQVAGERTPGKASGEIRWHGSQSGRVMLADRQLKVKRPRLRHKQHGGSPCARLRGAAGQCGDHAADDGRTAARRLHAPVRSELSPPLQPSTAAGTCSSRAESTCFPTVSKPYQKPIRKSLWGCASSEEQIPQVIGKTEKTRNGIDGLEGSFTRPRQVRYQAALRPDKV